MSSALYRGTLSAEVCVGPGGGPSSPSPFEKCKYLSCCYPTLTSLSVCLVFFFFVVVVLIFHVCLDLDLDGNNNADGWSRHG